MVGGPSGAQPESRVSGSSIRQSSRASFRITINPYSRVAGHRLTSIKPLAGIDEKNNQYTKSTKHAN
jgi:hypothetical protein